MIKTDEQRAAHAAYMREYNRRNKDQIAKKRKERNSSPEAKAKKAEQDARYRKKQRDSGVFDTAEYRKYHAKKSAEYRKRHPEKAKQSKRKYYATEKGKEAKRRSDMAYVASGKRLAAERRRSYRPISEARKQARRRWAKNNATYYIADRAKRRSLSRNLSHDDFWILREASALAKLREKVLGGKWHVDHIIPVSRGGTSIPENLQVVPARWNMAKSNKHTDLFFGRA